MEVCKQSDVPTLIGGDFNMKPQEVDSRLLGSNQARIPLPAGITTYRSLANAHGSVIDHIISNVKEAPSNVSEDGALKGDHFPIIGGLTLRVKGSTSPVKIEARIPPNLQAGDAGGLRKLKLKLKKQTTNGKKTQKLSKKFSCPNATHLSWK